MVNSKNVISEIKERFPCFVVTPDMEPLPVIIFDYLVIDLIEALKKKDEASVNQFVEFIDDLDLSNDKAILAGFDEIVIGLYDSEEVNYLEFRDRLSAAVQFAFNKTVSLWESQFK